MAKQSNTYLFISTDFIYQCMILNSAEDEAVDIDGWSLSWTLKTDPHEPDVDAMLTITTNDNILISGTYATNPPDNDQYAYITVEDTDTTLLKPGLYFWELKRTDVGYASILAYGQLDLIRSIHE